MFVAGATGCSDPVAQGRACIFSASGLGQELAKLEISCDVIGMRSKQRREVLVSGSRISGIGAFHSQAVSGESVLGLGGDEFFQDLAARLLLWLGRGHAHSIFALGRNANLYDSHTKPDPSILNEQRGARTFQ